MEACVPNIVVILSAGDCCGIPFSPTEAALQIVASKLPVPRKEISYKVLVAFILTFIAPQKCL